MRLQAGTTDTSMQRDQAVEAILALQAGRVMGARDTVPSSRSTNISQHQDGEATGGAHGDAQGRDVAPARSDTTGHHAGHSRIGDSMSAYSYDHSSRVPLAPAADVGAYPDGSATNSVPPIGPSSDAELASSDPPSRHAPRRRNRLAFSCTHCRDRKIRCSRETPCQQCIKRGEQDTCHVEPFKHRAAAEREERARKAAEAAIHASKDQHVRLLQERLRFLEEERERQIIRSGSELNALKPSPTSTFELRPPTPATSLSTKQPTVATGSSAATPSSGSTSALTSAPALLSVNGKPIGNHVPSSISSDGSPQSFSDEFQAIKSRMQALEAFFSLHKMEAQTATPNQALASVPSPPQVTLAPPESTASAVAIPDASASTASTIPRVPPTAPPLAPPAPAQELPASSPSPRPGAQNQEANAQQLTDAEDAVTMLESLVRSSEVSSWRQAVKCSERMSDRMTMSKLVHQHNTSQSTNSRSRAHSDPSNNTHNSALRPSQSTASNHPLPSPVTPKGDEPESTSPSTSRKRKRSSDSPKLENVRNHSLDDPASPASTGSAQKEETTSCLGARHNGLLKVYNGSEARLGFGIGWAFAAAAEKGEFHAMRKAFLASGQGEGDGNAEREAVLRVIVRTLPSREIILMLLDSYVQRANFLTTRVIHSGQFKRELETLLACTDDASRAHVMNQLDPGWLALLFMVLVLGLKFSPCPNTRETRTVASLLNASCTLNCWYSSAKAVLSMCNFGVSRPTLPLIQALLLMDIHGAEDDSTKIWLHQTAHLNARTIRIDRLGSKPTRRSANNSDSGEKVPQEDVLRFEMEKRVWWAIVSREWYHTHENHGFCTIMPEQFTTPQPNNYSDSDLELDPVPPPHPADEYTDTSYSLALISLSEVMREHMDLVNRRARRSGEPGGKAHLSPMEIDEVDASYRSLLETRLPPFYRIRGPTPNASVVMERALLHSIIFSQLLRLHRFSLSSRTDSSTDGLPGGRDTCVLLARSMLNALGTLQQGLTAIGRLACLRGHVFQASAVLMLDLCRRPQKASERAQIRKQVMNAIAALHCTLHLNPLVKRSLRILLALMAEEQVQWEAQSARLGSPIPPDATIRPVPNTDTMFSLACRIKDVMEQQQESDELLPEEVAMVETAVTMCSEENKDEKIGQSAPNTPRVLRQHSGSTLSPAAPNQQTSENSIQGTSQPTNSLEMPTLLGSREETVGGTGSGGMANFRTELSPLFTAVPLPDPELPFMRGARGDISASQQLFLPVNAADRPLHFNVLPTPTLGGEGDPAFDLSAFLTQYQSRPDLAVNASGTPQAPISTDLLPSATSQSVGTPQVDGITPPSNSTSAPGKNSLTALPQMGPFDPSFAPPASAEQVAFAQGQDPTSVDSFWRWILDQGGISSVSGAPNV